MADNDRAILAVILIVVLVMHVIPDTIEATKKWWRS